MDVPRVGDLATLYYPSDRYPCVVTAVTAGGARVELAELEPEHLRPVNAGVPFPTFDAPGDLARPNGRVYTAVRTRVGYRVHTCVPVVFGHAHYHRDFSD